MEDTETTAPTPSPDEDADACVGFAIEGLEMNEALEPNGVRLVVIPEHDAATTAEPGNNYDVSVQREEARKLPPKGLLETDAEQPQQNDIAVSPG